jgi:hypothetical protein
MLVVEMLMTTACLSHRPENAAVLAAVVLVAINSARDAILVQYMQLRRHSMWALLAFVVSNCQVAAAVEAAQQVLEAT